MRRQLFNTIEAWLEIGGRPDLAATSVNGIARTEGIFLAGSGPQLI